MSTVRPDTALPQHSALTTVRRLILFLLLFALVLIAASGLSGLLGRLFSSGTSLAEGDVGGLARSLAFALVGGTLAAILWWAVWRRLREGGERAALSWGLYVAGVYAVALITFATALLGLASSLIGGVAPQWYSEAATGLVWALVWVWHRWMWLHPARGPRHLARVPIVVGSVFGLLIGTGGAATALGNLLEAGLQGFTGTQSVGNPWWIPVLQSLVWAAGGAALWWWHWIRGRGRFLTTGLANVALAVVGVLGGCILALSGAIALVHVLLRLAFDRSGPVPQLLDPLGPAVAAAAIGSMVWRYHAALAGHRPGAMREASRLLAAGAALVAAASGIGVVVNASLGLAETALAGTGLRTLLLGGLSALSVGGPVWWQMWDPLHPRHHQRIHERSLEPSEHRGQRIYLVVVFGISAVVALIALLVIGYLAFEHLLDASGRGSLLGRVRAPLGLLTATGLVAAYHYGVWRRERAVTPPTEPVPPPGEPPTEPVPRGGIGHVILVTASDPVPLSRAIRDASGAEVTVWKRTDGGAAAAGSGTAGSGTEGSGAEPDPSHLAEALNGISCTRALVVVGRDGRIDVIPLADGAASGDGKTFDR